MFFLGLGRICAQVSLLLLDLGPDVPINYFAGPIEIDKEGLDTLIKARDHFLFPAKRINKTALTASLDHAYFQAEKLFPQAKKFVVILSDGLDNYAFQDQFLTPEARKFFPYKYTSLGNVRPLQEMISERMKETTTSYVVEVFSSSLPPDQRRKGHAFLRTLASSGRLYTLDDFEEIIKNITVEAEHGPLFLTLITDLSESLRDMRTEILQKQRLFLEGLTAAFSKADNTNDQPEAAATENSDPSDSTLPPTKIEREIEKRGGRINGVMMSFAMYYNDKENRNDGDEDNDEDEEFQTHDYDNHWYGPNGSHVWYMSMKNSIQGVFLDVDVTHPKHGVMAIERIYFEDLENLLDGDHSLRIHNYAQRSGKSGFKIEFSFFTENEAGQLEKKILNLEYNGPFPWWEEVEIIKLRKENGQLCIVRIMGKDIDPVVIANHNDY